MSEDYTKLKSVLDAAYSQSAEGKGRSRHNKRGVSFERQPILEIGRMVGHGFALGQAMKKAQEASTMADNHENENAIRELLGAIVYTAAAVVLLIERADDKAEAAPAQAPRKPVSDYAPARVRTSEFKDVATVPTPRPALSESLRAVDDQK